MSLDKILQSPPLPDLSPFFQRLVDIFDLLNTNLTFIASHARASVPTYDLIVKLNPEIQPLDLAVIKHLFPPGQVFFDYVDPQQIELSLADDVKHSWEHGYEAHKNSVDDAYAELAQMHRSLEQILVFDFQDTRVDGIGSRLGGYGKKRPLPDSGGFFLQLKKLQLQSLTQDHMKLMIKSRRRRFVQYLTQYIEANEDPEQSIMKQVKLPEKVDYDADLVTNQGVKRRRAEVRPDLDLMYETLKQEPFYSGQIKYEGYLTRTEPPRYADFEIEVDGEFTIHPELREALIKSRGIDIAHNMYTHQQAAILALLLETKQHVIVSTSTGSGKSLVYQIPILNDILWDRVLGDRGRKSTAFFIFPTKALAQDQKHNLDLLLAHIPSLEGVVVETYDGDTPQKQRQYVRAHADIIFTNPDTIHAAILPGSEAQGWSDFLDHLKYVVMDEIHVYKGLFGIHVSMVMARLQRLVLANLRFVLCSATIKDPLPHFSIVCSIPDNEIVIHVDDDGSPHTDRKLLAWQPPPLMNKQGHVQLHFDDEGQLIPEKFIPRENVITELAKIMCQLLTQIEDVKILVFCPIRKICEFLMKEVRTQLNLNAFVNRTGIRPTEIMSYRGGYAKSDRRVIEQKMFKGELRAIIATNALELGIDLLDLDVVIACGFPLSKLNLHQQFGRAGRGRNSKGSLAIFVGGANAVDLHYLEHGPELIERSYEDLCVGLLMEMGSHRMIMEMHMQCAAFERPLVAEDDCHWFDKRFFQDILDKKLHKDAYGRYRCDPLYLPWPAEKVGIRAVEEQLYAIVDTTNGRNVILEELEVLRVPFTLYDGGIFLHQGNPYLIREFNAEGKYAKVERVNVNWTTTQRDFTDVDPVEINYVKQFHGPDGNPTDLPVFYGSIRCEMRVFGYFKINRRGEILEAVDVDQDSVVAYLKGFWIDIPLTAIDIIVEKRLNAAAGIHGAQHAIINILPLFILGGASTNPNAKFTSSIGEAELSTECKAPEKEFAQRQSRRKRPSRLVFYDTKGGANGLGMSAKTFEYIDSIIGSTFERVINCECEWGCPLCVQGTFCKENSLVISKPAAIIILAAVLGKKPEEYRYLVDDGPEANLPEIGIETIEKAPLVRFAPDVQVMDFKLREPKPGTIVKEEEESE
ncbi:DEAD/DEAH box helicase [Kocuria palustris]|nr:DEAD/DEAH box helicase [Kocuria palustris]